MKELWKIIPNVGNRYAMSNRGKVFSVVSCQYLAIMDNGNGYKKVMVHYDKDGKRVQQSRYIHRMMAQAFIPNPEGHKYVGHKDHDKSNNSVDNLYWTSASGNTKDGIRDGKINYKGRYNGPIAKHSDDVVREVYRRCTYGGEGLVAVSRELGVNRTTAASWVKGQSRRDVTQLVDKELNN